MKFLDKIKNALFEEEEEQEESVIAKKIDIEKTVEEKNHEPEVKHRFEEEEEIKEEPRKTPVLFDDEDFLSDTKDLDDYKTVPRKEERILYGGYEIKETEKSKDKFKPSPVISPVYGIVTASNMPKVEVNNKESKNIDNLFVEERKKSISLDEIRQKAFGFNKEEKEEAPQEIDESPILYDMKEDDKPAIEKITLGDAEEYFRDLGLEYEVDYKDLNRRKMARTKKNEDLSDMVKEEIKEDMKIRKEDVFKRDDDLPLQDDDDDDLFADLEDEDKLSKKEVNVPDDGAYTEKNLYDLIDMMYDSKE